MLNLIRFVYDTGCTVTSLTEDTLYQLGYTKDWCLDHGLNTEVDTANTDGLCKAYRIVLPMVTLLGNVFHNVEVVTNQGKYNLLGMNILNCYNWILSPQDKIIKYSFIGNKGKGHQIKTITGMLSDFSAYNLVPLDFTGDKPKGS